MPRSEEDEDSKVGLVGQIRRIPSLISRLIRDEVAAAKAELSGKIKSAGLGIGLAAGGAIFALFALGTLINAGVSGLAHVVPYWLAALIIGIVLALISVVLILLGVGKLKKGVPPVPTETIESVKADIRSVKGTNR
jgi:hypothetical protein